MQQQSAPSALRHESGWGEKIVPFLVIGMETCWLDVTLVGLGKTGLLGTSEPLLPLWLPFVLIAGFYVLSRGLGIDTANEDSKKHTRPTRLFLLLLSGFTALLVTRLVPYAFQQGATSWPGNVAGAFSQFDATALQLVSAIAMSFALCRHGTLLAESNIGPAQVQRMTRFGLLLLLILIGAWTLLTIMGRLPGDILPLVQASGLFCLLALTAQILARISVIRRRHRLDVHVAAQERRALMLVIALSLLVLLTAFGLGNTLSAPIALNIGPPAIEHPLPPGASGQMPGGGGAPLPPSSKDGSVPLSDNGWWLTLLNILIIAVLIAGAITLIVMLLRHRFKFGWQRSQDIHESIWSWQLFWMQLKGLLAILFTRFILRGLHAGKDEGAQRDYSTPFAKDSIRGIYHALLQQAAQIGYPRRSSETPYEFGQRLAQELPALAASVIIITNAYVVLRYGEIEPEGDETTQVQQVWDICKTEMRLPQPQAQQLRPAPTMQPA